MIHIELYGKDRRLVSENAIIPVAFDLSEKKNSVGTGSMTLRIDDHYEQAWLAVLFVDGKQVAEVLLGRPEPVLGCVNYKLIGLLDLLAGARTPKRWTRWDEAAPDTVLSSMPMRFEMLKYTSVTDFESHVQKSNIEIDKLYSGDLCLEQYAWDDGVRFYSSGHIVYFVDCGAGVLSSGRFFRWGEEIGEAVRITVQSVASSVAFGSVPSFAGAPERDAMHSGDLKGNETAGIELADGGRYLAIRINLYWNDSAFNQSKDVWSGDIDGQTEKIYGYTPILTGFEVLYLKPALWIDGGIDIPTQDPAKIKTDGRTYLDIARDTAEAANAVMAMRFERPALVGQAGLIKFMAAENLGFDFGLSSGNPVVLRGGDNANVKAIARSEGKQVTVLHCYGAGNGADQLYAAVRRDDLIQAGWPIVEGDFEDSSIETKSALEAAGAAEMNRIWDENGGFEVDTVTLLNVDDKVVLAHPESGYVGELRIEERKIEFSKNSVRLKYGIGGLRFNPMRKLLGERPMQKLVLDVVPVPDQFVAIGGYDSITASWVGEGDGFHVEYRVKPVSGDPDWFRQWTKKSPFTLPGRDHGVVYQFRVATIRGNRVSPFSEISEAAATGAVGPQGPAGQSGLNSAVVFLYKRGATAPAKPSTTAIYAFSTGVLTGHNNGWSQTVPNTDGNPLWVITAVAAATAPADTDSIEPAEWSAQNKIVQDGATGTPGSDGAPGLNQATIQLYQRKATAPAVTDIADPITYTFVTGAISGALGAWSRTVPAGSNPLYTVMATAIGSSTTDTITRSEWSAPVIIAENGAAGTPAQYVVVNGEQAFKYAAGASTPTPASITLRADLFGGLSAYLWQYWTGAAWANLSGTNNAQTYALAHDNAAWGSAVQLRVRCRSGADTVTDEITIVKVYDGATGATGPQGVQGIQGVAGTNGSDGQSAITAILSNHAHTLPASAAGVVSDYAGSGGTIQVYEGSTLLTFHTTLANGRFTVGTPVVAPSGKITVGARSGSGTTTCTVAQHSAMDNATDSLTITYPLTVQRANGTQVTLSLVQTITKSKVGATGDQGPAGVDAISILLSNEAHVIACDKLGQILAGELGSGSKAACTVRVFRGGTELAYGTGANQWNMGLAMAAGIAAVQTTSSFYMTAAWTDTGVVDLTINIVGGATIARQFSYSKQAISYKNIMNTSRLIADATLPTRLTEGAGASGGWLTTGGGTQCVQKLGPHGLIVPVIQCSSTDPVATTNGGISSQREIIDKTKRYRHSIFVQILDNSGRWRIGAYPASGHYLTLAGAATTAPYFFSLLSMGPVPLVPGKWYLLVGNIYENGYSGGISSDSGIYDVVSRTKIRSLDAEFKFADTATLNGMYSTLYSGGTPDLTTTQKMWLYSPRIDVVDGSEPSIAKLLEGGVVGPSVSLTASSQIMRFDKDGIPTSGDITLTAVPANNVGSVVFSTSPTVTLTGSGNTRTLTPANYGANTMVQVTVTVDGVSDAITISRVQDGATGLQGATGDTGATGPQGIGVVTWVKSTNAQAIDPFTIKKISGTAWREGAYSQEKYGACHVTFNPNATNLAFMVGLDDAPPAWPVTADSYISMEHCFSLRTDGRYEIRAPGNTVKLASSAATAYTVNTTFEIVYDGAHVFFCVNGVVVHIQYDPGRVFAVALSFSSNNAQANYTTFTSGGIAVREPKYLGTIATNPPTVDSFPNNRMAGDWCLSTGAKTLYAWSGTAWTTTGITNAMNMVAMRDLLELVDANGATEFITRLVTRSVFANEIAALKIFLQATGVIYGGERFDDTGAVLDETKAGLWLSALGQFLLEGPDLSINKDRARFFKGQGVQRRALQISDESLDWVDCPDTTPASPEQLRARIGRLGVGNNILMDGNFNKNIFASFSPELIIDSSVCSSPDLIQIPDGRIRIVYRRSDGRITTRFWNGAWSGEHIITPVAGSNPRFLQRSDSTLWMYYTRDSDGYIRFTSTLIGTNDWTSENTLVSANSSRPSIILLKSGKMRLAYRRNTDGYLVERIHDGSWGSESVVNAANSDYPTYIERYNGEQRIAYWASYSLDTVMVERVWNESTQLWGSQLSSFPELNGGKFPRYLELISNELQIVYRDTLTGYVVRRVFNGVSWSNSENLTSVSLGDPGCIQLMSGDIKIAYYRSGVGLVEITQQRYAQLGAGIIESGRNNNGYWAMYSDGTLEWWGGFVAVAAVTTALTSPKTFVIGGTYSEWLLGISAIQAPTVSVGGMLHIWQQGAGTSFHYYSQYAQQTYFHVIGRWKP